MTVDVSQLEGREELSKILVKIIETGIESSCAQDCNKMGGKVSGLMVKDFFRRSNLERMQKGVKMTESKKTDEKTDYNMSIP